MGAIGLCREATLPHGEQTDPTSPDANSQETSERKITRQLLNRVGKTVATLILDAKGGQVAVISAVDSADLAEWLVAEEPNAIRFPSGLAR